MPPLVTSWYAIWAKVVLIVDTYRMVVTLSQVQPDELKTKPNQTSSKQSRQYRICK